MSTAVSEILRLEGALTMATVANRVDEGRERVRAGDLAVDLSGITDADSAALALLFDWLRTARAAGHEMSIVAMPPGLRTLAALYGVDELLPAQA